MRRYILEGHSHEGIVDITSIIGTRKIAEMYACKLTENSQYEKDAVYYTVVGSEPLTVEDKRS